MSPTVESAASDRQFAHRKRAKFQKAYTNLAAYNRVWRSGITTRVSRELDPAPSLSWCRRARVGGWFARPNARRGTVLIHR